MSEVTIEKIEELRKRAKVSYEEAKNLLNKHNGDIIEALIELEKGKKIETGHCCKDHREGFSKMKRLFRKGNRIKFLVTRKGETVANLPINYVLVSMIFGFHLFIATLIIIFITGCKMSIKKSADEIMDVDDAIIKVASNVKKGAEHFASEMSKSDIFKCDSDDISGTDTKSGIDLSKEKKEKEEKKTEKGYNEHVVE